MSRKKKNPTQFMNDLTYIDYFNRLLEIATNVFEWKNLPETIDERYLEKQLCMKGSCVYFNDPVLGDLALPAILGGRLDVYENPIVRRAYSVNGYQKELDSSNSVIIWNNYMREPSLRTLQLYAQRLAEIQRTIDTNVLGQKTPVTILCDEKQVLTMKNFYNEVRRNEPVIIGDKSINIDGVKTLDTASPYVADKLEALKKQTWLDALSYCGVENSNSEKAERLVSTEVVANLGNVEAQRYIRLNARRQAADSINKMFGTNIEVNFRQTAGALSEGDTTDDSIIDDRGDDIYG